MSRKHFGTDGVRGVANVELTPELALQLGRATGRWLRDSGSTPRAVVGRDSRRSGPMLGAALASGLCSEGVDVATLGIAPTPAIAYVARTEDFGLGAIISASHNPAPDNGIKLIGHDGRKLSDETEQTIESIMESLDGRRPSGVAVGSLVANEGALADYADFLETLLPERLDGIRVAVDCAHGAAYRLGPDVLRRLGAEVVVSGDLPDGMNINAEGGATKPETIQKLTLDAKADIGVAFDGDADRAVFCDETGSLINGDRTIGIWSSHWRIHGRMAKPVVVGTVMSNGGFERFLTARGIELRRTKVGDKYVAEEIARSGASVGGEQSGHLIFPELGPTGDGLATMLEFIRVIRREGRPASSFVADYEAWPQVLVNLKMSSREGWELRPGVAEAIAAAERRLASHGRLSVRPSGTQPMLRVMIEAESIELRDAVRKDLLALLGQALDAEISSEVDLTHALGD